MTTGIPELDSKADFLQFIPGEGPEKHVKRFLVNCDFILFIHAVKTRDVAKMIVAVRNPMKVREITSLIMDLTCNSKMKRSYIKAGGLCASCCDYYGRRLKPKARFNDCTEGQWERIKAAAEKCVPLLQGFSKDKAERAIRRWASVNQRLMAGLPLRLRVWKQ